MFFGEKILSKKTGILKINLVYMQDPNMNILAWMKKIVIPI
jgi:hypothetical protein